WDRGRGEVRVCEGGLDTGDVAVDLFRGERYRCERVFDLVGDAASDLLPGGLFLRTEEFGGVFEHEHVAVGGAIGAAAAFKQRDGSEQIHGAAIGRAGDGHLHLGRSGAHAVRAAEEVVERLHGFRGEDAVNGGADEGGLAAGVEHFGQGASDEDDAAVDVERGDAVGDGREHCLEL